MRKICRKTKENVRRFRGIPHGLTALKDYVLFRFLTLFGALNTFPFLRVMPLICAAAILHVRPLYIYAALPACHLYGFTSSGLVKKPLNSGGTLSPGSFLTADIYFMNDADHQMDHYANFLAEKFEMKPAVTAQETQDKALQKTPFTHLLLGQFNDGIQNGELSPQAGRNPINPLPGDMDKITGMDLMGSNRLEQDEFATQGGYEPSQDRYKQAQYGYEPSQAGFEPGDERVFFVRDVQNPTSWTEERARLMTLNNGVAVWFRLSDLDIYYQPEVMDEVMRRVVGGDRTLETQTAANQVYGILPHLTDTFGPVPDSESPLIHLLFLDIQDRYEETGSYVAGFFDPVNGTDHPFSNRMNLLYLDLYPGLFRGSEKHADQEEKNKTAVAETAEVSALTATIAHELQHLIHSQSLPSGESSLFVNEGFSELAEIITGHPPRDASPYFQESHRPLFSWSYQNPLPDYSRASLFIHYLYEKIGGDFLSIMISNGWSGAYGLWNAVHLTSRERLEDLFVEWGRDLLKGSKESSSTQHEITHPEILHHEIPHDLHEDWAYQHPARRHLRFPVQDREWMFPAASSMHRTAWSHQWMSMPFTSRVGIKAEHATGADEWLALAETPDYKEMLQTYRDGAWIRTQSNQPRPHQTILMLKSSTGPVPGSGPLHVSTPESEGGDMMDTFLVEGTKTAERRWQSFGDGRPQVFLDNASFLLVPEGSRMGFEFLRSEPAWLRGVRLKLIHLNEVTGSGIPATAERNIRVSVEKYSDGEWQVAIPVFTHEVQRQNGYLSYEYIRWPGSYNLMKGSAGRFRIVLEPDITSGNLFAVGMQQSHTENSLIHRNGVWSSLHEAFPETFRETWGGIVEAEWIIPLVEDEVFHGIVSEMKVHNDFVSLELTLPEPANPQRSSLVARLPDGRYVQGGWMLHGENLRAEFPLQAGAQYEFNGLVTGADSGRRYKVEYKDSIREDRLVQVTGNYPNPFNPSTQIEFTLLEPGELTLRVFDLLGRQVLAESPSYYVAGSHQKRLDLSGFATGIYFVRAETQRSRDGFFAASTHKILMVR